MFLKVHVTKLSPSKSLIWFIAASQRLAVTTDKAAQNKQNGKQQTRSTANKMEQCYNYSVRSSTSGTRSTGLTALATSWYFALQYFLYTATRVFFSAFL